MKKQTKFALTLIACLALVFVGFRLQQLWPQYNTPIPETTLTKEITHESSIGGIAFSAPSAPPAPPSLPKPEQPAPTPQAPAASLDSVFQDRAPRQTEIQASVKKEYPYQALGMSNDPLTKTSWALTNTKAQAAWDISTGSNVVVAVIDSGFALQHEDLINQWYTNAGELGQTQVGDRCWSGVAVDKSTNACDDDNNGYVDDWRGWDFVSRTNNPQAGKTNPAGNGVSHGTEVAGLVGATGNNGKGIATYSWNTRLLPLQVLDDNGSGYTSGVISAIYYAVDRGAQVINMSLGGDTDDPALAQAISYAYSHNVVVVAAAGNCGTGQEYGCDPTKPGAMGYPALNRHVIAVGAATSANTRASFSSYGPGLDVIAPGSGTIASPMWLASNQTSAYASSLYGTSFSSPLVAGYVALIKSIRPNTSVDDITAIVDGSAQKPPAMNSVTFTNEYGHGIINAQQSLVVGTTLTGSASAPTLKQTGSAFSEHAFNNTTTLSSGCETSLTTYCTVWAYDGRGYDRYLPYTLTTSERAGWTWSGSVLGAGEWRVYARSGDQTSTTPYILFQK